MDKEIDVVISGGSMEGICGATGFLKALIKDLGFTVISAAGTSAGGVILGAYASGMDVEDIEKTVLNTKFSNLIRIPKWYNIIRIIKALRCGWLSDGEDIQHAFELITHHKTFKQSQIDLHIAGTDLAKGDVHDFNCNNDPDMALALAMRITCCVPGCFKPPSYNGSVWYDGSIRSHYPVELIPKSDRPIYGFLASHLNSDSDPMRSMNGIYGVISRLIDATLDMNVRYSTKVAHKNPNTIAYSGPKSDGWKASRLNRARLIDHARDYTIKKVLEANKSCAEDSQDHRDSNRLSA